MALRHRIAWLSPIDVHMRHPHIPCNLPLAHSANFIQEMRVGVFPKVLRNLWICAMLCNPVLSTLSLGLMPLSEVRAHKSVVLLRMAEIAGGPWLAYWVAADAFLVLAGAVLTAYVGVVGLTKRCDPVWHGRARRAVSLGRWIYPPV